MGLQRTLLAVSATQAGFAFLPGSVQTEPPVETSFKLAQTGDIFSPKVAAMFTFVRVVVEPGVWTTAVAWEAPAKRSLAFYLSAPFGGQIVRCCNSQCCSSRLQVPGVAAAYIRSSVDLGSAAAEGGSGPPVGTEVIGAGRWGGKIGRAVGMCGSWASPRNPGGK